MRNNSQGKGEKSLTFVSRQKWEANLCAEDSLAALEIMERLGFETRAEFIRHALTNSVLLEQHAAFSAVEQAAAELTALRTGLTQSGADARSLKRLERQLREIYAAVQQGVIPCLGHS